MICTKITVKYLLRILTITTNKLINSILISRNANPQDGCGGIIIYHKLASVLHSRSCRYALDINWPVVSFICWCTWNHGYEKIVFLCYTFTFYFLTASVLGASFTPITWNSCQEIVHALLVIKHHDLKKDFQSRNIHTNFSLLIFEVIDRYDHSAAHCKLEYNAQ